MGKKQTFDLNLSTTFSSERIYAAEKKIHENDIVRLENTTANIDLQSRPLLGFLVHIIKNGGNLNFICQQHDMKALLKELIGIDRELNVLLKTENYIFLLESEKYRLRFVALSHFCPNYEKYFVPDYFFPKSICIEEFSNYFGPIPPFYLFEELQDTEVTLSKKRQFFPVIQ